jgi:hypothetical protein
MVAPDGVVVGDRAAGRDQGILGLIDCSVAATHPDLAMKASESFRKRCRLNSITELRDRRTMHVQRRK